MRVLLVLRKGKPTSQPCNLTSIQMYLRVLPVSGLKLTRRMICRRNVRSEAGARKATRETASCSRTRMCKACSIAAGRSMIRLSMLSPSIGRCQVCHVILGCVRCGGMCDMGWSVARRMLDGGRRLEQWHLVYGRSVCGKAIAQICDGVYRN
jgi:hypothetical protein